MLDYGLSKAINELANNLSDRQGISISIQNEIPPTETRFDSGTELHIFRIVQQACENTIRHAQATKLRIYGKIESQQILVNVEDDGQGFDTQPSLDLVNLLENNHFGLAGMIERAALINANVDITSEPNRGTRVVVQWNRNKETE
jgi:two-component system sensor histidine kinase DegS